MYEVEVKSLLGSPERAEEIRNKMVALDPSCTTFSHNKQLNHYFVPASNMDSGTLKKIGEGLEKYMRADAKARLDDLAGKATDFSVRTRDKDGRVYIVVKVTVGSDTSANGVARMEFEESVPLTIHELDSFLQSIGFQYQAKWSREREEYRCKGINVTLDKNAGYGWLAEFERVVDEESRVEGARQEVYALMRELGVEELPQDRLERMFEHYNAHWPEYYGTEKIFVVK
jgi:predicted adenylyl cyclase CyaB